MCYYLQVVEGNKNRNHFITKIPYIFTLKLNTIKKNNNQEVPQKME